MIHNLRMKHFLKYNLRHFTHCTATTVIIIPRQHFPMLCTESKIVLVLLYPSISTFFLQLTFTSTKKSLLTRNHTCLGSLDLGGAWRVLVTHFLTAKNKNRLRKVSTAIYSIFLGMFKLKPMLMCETCRILRPSRVQFMFLYCTHNMLSKHV